MNHLKTPYNTTSDKGYVSRETNILWAKPYLCRI